jgi:hypothetical protein
MKVQEVGYFYPKYTEEKYIKQVISFYKNNVSQVNNEH